MIMKRKMKKQKIIKLRNSIVDLNDVNNHIKFKGKFSTHFRSQFHR